MLSLLTGAAPALFQIALWLINLFISDKNQRAANERAFLQAISNHAGDALASALARQNAWDQRQELKQKADEIDAANKEQKPPQ